MSEQRYIPSFSRLERAASIIDCEVEDILQLAATGEINISINLGSSVISPDDLEANGYIYLTGLTDISQVDEMVEPLFEMSGAKVVLNKFVKLPLTDAFKALVTPDQVDEIIDMELGDFAPIAPVKLVGQFELSTIEAETLYRSRELAAGNLYSAQFKMLLGDQLCEALCCLQYGQKTTLNELTITRANILKASEIFKGNVTASECSINTFEQVKRSMMAVYLDDDDKKPIAVELPTVDKKDEENSNTNITDKQLYALTALMSINPVLKPILDSYPKRGSLVKLRDTLLSQIQDNGIDLGPLESIGSKPIKTWITRGAIKKIDV